MAEQEFEWEILVRRWDHYGQRVESTTPATIVAPNKSAVTTTVRAMFEAEYDSFRKFWSHDWALISVRSTAAAGDPA